MKDVINLRTVRKQKQREEARVTASENARKHGLSKSERMLVSAREDKSRKMLDQHYLDEE